MKINIITSQQLIEGITASITFPIFIYFLKYVEGFSLIYYTSLAWLITWFLRKISVNIFLIIKEKYLWNNRQFYIEI